jgi:putative transposase
VKYAWIEKHRQTYCTALMCELLSVSRSGLNAAREREPSQRAQDDRHLVEQIRQGQRKHRGRYGRRRMTPEIGEVLGAWTTSTGTPARSPCAGPRAGVKT